MFIETDFSYNGVMNTSMVDGTLKLVRFNKGMLKQNMGVKRKTQTTSGKHVKKNQLHYIQESVIKFNISIAKDTPWTDNDKIEITRWLFTDTYKDFKSEDSPYIYKCIGVGANFYNNSLNMGYATIEFECNSAYAYTELSITNKVISGNGTMTIDNKCNIHEYQYNPEIEVKLNSGTEFRIVNETNRGQVFEYTGLTSGETIYTNNETGVIISNTNKPRLANLTDRRFMSLTYGTNVLNITGNCEIAIRTQYPIMI